MYLICTLATYIDRFVVIFTPLDPKDSLRLLRLSHSSSPIYYIPRMSYHWLAPEENNMYCTHDASPFPKMTLPPPYPPKRSSQL